MVSNAGDSGKPEIDREREARKGDRSRLKPEVWQKGLGLPGITIDYLRSPAITESGIFMCRQKPTSLVHTMVRGFSATR